MIKLIKGIFYFLKNGWEEVKDNDQKVDSLPKDVSKVIIKGNKVIVMLVNGTKGIAECHGGDEFDVLLGFTHAYYKAKYSKCFYLRNVLISCVNNAKKKGYKQAILKNYNEQK